MTHRIARLESRERPDERSATTAPCAAADWVACALDGLPKILTSPEVQGVLRTSRRNLYRLVASGRIHAVRAAEGGSSRLLIPKTSLEKYLRALDGS